MLQPAPHVRFAITGEDLIMLDLAADRYVGMPGATLGGDAERLTLCDRLHPEAIAALEEAGFLIEGRPPTADALSIPDRSRVERVGASQRPTFRDVFDLLLVLMVTGWRIWRRRPCRRQELGRTTLRADDQELSDALDKLDRLRLVVPTPRRCLPSALVTSLWLRRRSCDAEIVFGVRSHPFEAHCWAEHAGMVIDDDLDRVSRFAPIAVAVP